jgi:hypothetical protein
MVTALFRPTDIQRWIGFDDAGNSAMDHSIASDAILGVMAKRHEIQSFVANIDGVDVSQAFETIMPSFSGRGKQLTAQELHKYLVTRHGLEKRVQGEGEEGVKEVRLDVMDVDSLEQKSFVGNDVIDLTN